MDTICEQNKCTGCGMCTNICPEQAIKLKEGLHGFVFPIIDESLCINCGLCEIKCPSNLEKQCRSTVQEVYAAWNHDKKVRKESSSGGIFTLIAEKLLEEGGVVAGVAWDEQFHPHHVMCDNVNDLEKLRGSKYSQSNTGDIYRIIKHELSTGRKVLFSGTPCQNAALKSYLDKDYYNLFMVDLVCHGVPSNKILDDYFNLFHKKINNVNLRYKDPYWDYSFVKIDFVDGTKYQVRTIYDDYFNLFNVGYSLRESCHECRYTTLHRESDITLADFWGYKAHNFKSINYNKGTSLIIINSRKGQELINLVKKTIYVEKSNIDTAIRGNKCLKEPFKIDEQKLAEFWHDYENGMTVKELNQKYTAGTFTLPKHLVLRRNINRFRWIIKR